MNEKNAQKYFNHRSEQRDNRKKKTTTAAPTEKYLLVERNESVERWSEMNKNNNNNRAHCQMQKMLMAHDYKINLNYKIEWTQKKKFITNIPTKTGHNQFNPFIQSTALPAMSVSCHFVSKCVFSLVALIFLFSFSSPCILTIPCVCVHFWSL